MKFNFLIAILLLIFTPILAFSVPNSKCQFKKVVLKQNAKNSSLWEGRFDGSAISMNGDKNGITFKGGKISSKLAKKSCSFEIDDAGDDEGVYGVAQVGQLFITKSYGSGDEITIIDITNCHQIPFKFNVQRVRFSDHAIESSTVCEPTGTENNCSCSAATVYSLNERCELVLDAKAGKEITKKELGTESPPYIMECPQKWSAPR